MFVARECGSTACSLPISHQRVCNALPAPPAVSSCCRHISENPPGFNRNCSPLIEHISPMTEYSSPQLAMRICGVFTQLHPHGCVWHCYFLDMNNSASILVINSGKSGRSFCSFTVFASVGRPFTGRRRMPVAPV